MTDFFRILKLAGVKMLLEALSPTQAKGIFLHYGATEAGMKPDQLKNTWKKLALTYHPDRTGGDHDHIAMINAAYDVLKKGEAPSTAPAPENEFPAWQTDSRSRYNRINRNDYTDINYFKKRMWELSGRSHEKWTIWAFDGHFFRGVLTVFGSPEIFDDMAKAMVTWNSMGANSYHTRAVFVQKEGEHDISLIWLDGRPVKPPVHMEHESFNANPGNDQSFTRRLPRMLDQIITGVDITV